MNTVACKPLTCPAPLPAHTDLRSAVGGETLLGLALEAALAVGGALGPAGPAQPNPRMLLTLLTYSYACAWFSAEEVAWRARSEPALRYLCARETVRAPDVRRFRRTQRRWLEECLAHVIAEVGQRSSPRAALPGDAAPASHADRLENAADQARRRLTLALQLDAADCD